MRAQNQCIIAPGFSLGKADRKPTTSCKVEHIHSKTNDYCPVLQHYIFKIFHKMLFFS